MAGDRERERENGGEGGKKSMLNMCLRHLRTFVDLSRRPYRSTAHGAKRGGEAARCRRTLSTQNSQPTLATAQNTQLCDRGSSGKDVGGKGERWWRWEGKSLK